MKLFTLAEFEEKIKKEYSRDKYLIYLVAIILGIVSIKFLLVSLSVLLQGHIVVAFLLLIPVLFTSSSVITQISRSPELTQVYQVYWGNDFDDNVRKMFYITKKLKLKEQKYHQNIYYYYKDNWWKRERLIVIFFINEEGVWVNIQYGLLIGSTKLKDKIQSEFEQTKKTS